ncbi:MAG: hypothetical protein ABWZ80_06005 [Beijerinckiaceae bacterium]
MSDLIPRRQRPAPVVVRAREVRDKLEGEWKEQVEKARRTVEMTQGRVRQEALEARQRLKSEIEQATTDFKRSIERATGKVKSTRHRLEGEARLTAVKVRLRVAKVKSTAKKAADKLENETRFFRTWIESPLKTGAVSPSSPELAREMASYVDPNAPGLVVELGPGTGPVTEALITRGVPESRLLLLEYDPEFCGLLRRRFPAAKVVQGDAYAIEKALRGHLTGRVAAIVSSLPLMTRPPRERLHLLQQGFALLARRAPFVQFTYAAASPIPLRAGDFLAEAGKRIWKNIPPARVWVYRQA